MIYIPKRLRRAGQLLSNCAFNLSQDNDNKLDKDTKGLLKGLQREWDLALTEIREKNQKEKDSKKSKTPGSRIRNAFKKVGAKMAGKGFRIIQ